MFSFSLALMAAASATAAPTPPPPAVKTVFMFETGTSLLAKCRNKAPEYALACTAYIVGAVDGVRRDAFLGRAHPNCWPPLIMAEEVKRIVVAYLERWPDQRGAPAAVLVGIALNDRYPCQK